MSSLKAGDKVECMDNACNPPLDKHVVYTVQDITANAGEKDELLALVEIPGAGYYSWRFRLVEQEVKPQACTCPIGELMGKGCTCGAFQREMEQKAVSP